MPQDRERLARPATPGGCPVAPQAQTERKTAQTPEPAGPPLERDDRGVWHVRGYREARAILRHSGTRQAGFQAEFADRMPAYMNRPVLFQEGREHHEQRRQTASFFTPKTTDEAYRELMETLADDIVAAFIRRGEADLSQMSLRLAVAVAARVVGLTDSLRPGMAGRIDAFISQEQGELGWSPRQVAGMLRNQWRMLRFYLLDVRPAIKARQRSPRQDVISHLLGKGYSGMEILTECVTYGAAGMVTTREFIGAATWHLLERPALRARYLVAYEPERHAILHEILRLEPVVGHLYRRATTDLTLEFEGGEVTIPAGDLIDLHLYAVNAEEATVGEGALCLRPGRLLEHGARPYVMSFGDGHHRCPGAFIAIQETDIFLRRLLMLDRLAVKSGPTLSYNDTVKGYELRNFVLSLDG